MLPWYIHIHWIDRKSAFRPARQQAIHLKYFRSSQFGSATLQDDSSWPREASKTLQDAPKTRPRRNSEAKTLPRQCQDPPQLDFRRFGGPLLIKIIKISLPNSNWFDVNTLVQIWIQSSNLAMSISTSQSVVLHFLEIWASHFHENQQS